jgi:hypothetical protein
MWYSWENSSDKTESLEGEMPRKTILTCLIMIDILLLGCLASSLLSPKPMPTRADPADVFFKAYLNMPQAPSGISDFSGSGVDLFPVFLSEGSYHYKVDQKAFDKIISWDEFFNSETGNSPFHEIECTELSKWATTWSDARIDLEGKDCYTGMFTPYLHYLILDPVTGDVYHTFTGTRE